MTPHATAFGFTIHDRDQSIACRAGDHVKVYGTGRDRGFENYLSRRQADLLRIATAIHVADGWVQRLKSVANRHRRPRLDLEVMDVEFWSDPSTSNRLKSCVDFLSGGDDWSFRFVPSRAPRQNTMFDLFGTPAIGHEAGPVVALYSGGLDSAAGLAARMAASSGRRFVPVFVRHQMQKGKLIYDHLRLLIRSGLIERVDLEPFVVGASIMNGRIRRDFGVKLREVTHRCRPMLYLAVAGAVANTHGVGEVEIYESGVGSVNLPLAGGPADHRTTRSSHPRTLALMSDLISHVNGSAVRYILPFADRTKGEMVTGLRTLGLEELARRSVSCVLHPLKRKGGRQCGHCTACVYRRQAMWVAGIPEKLDAYDFDLFAPPELGAGPDPRHLVKIRAFQQQAGRLADLDDGRLPTCFRTYLYATGAVANESELAPHIEIYDRYRREWERLIAQARQNGVTWAMPARGPALAGGGVR